MISITSTSATSPSTRLSQRCPLGSTRGKYHHSNLPTSLDGSLQQQQLAIGSSASSSSGSLGINFSEANASNNGEEMGTAECTTRRSGPLCESIFNGQYEVAMQMIDVGGADINKNDDENGNTPLHIAAAPYPLEYCKCVIYLLLRAQLYSQISCFVGCTYHSYRGRIKGHTVLKGSHSTRCRLVLTLLKRGANPNAKNVHGGNCVYCSFSFFFIILFFLSCDMNIHHPLRYPSSHCL
jgi:hypothetical protein